MSEDLYLKRGVSANKEDVHYSIKNLEIGLYKNLFCKVFPDIYCNDENFVTLMSSDGSGTKSIIAYLYWLETGDATIFQNIGQDALVMNLDDMFSIGANSNFLFSSIINRNKNKIPKEIIKNIIEGTQNYINKLNDFGLNILYTGGETADVGDIVKTISVDGSMSSRMNHKNLIKTFNIKPSQYIISLASYGNCTYENGYNSGIGSNGLTSARHDLLSKKYFNNTESFDNDIDNSVLYNGKFSLSDIVYQNYNLGQLLLSPTISYAPILLKIFNTFPNIIESIIHLTGGANTKVLKFVDNVRIVKDNIIEIPPIFQLIQSSNNYSYQNMFNVFNMGNRLDLYLSDENIAKEIIQMIKEFGIDAKISGYVEYCNNNAIIEIQHENQNILYSKF